MRYYLDCEFNGYGGQLLSLALVPAATLKPALYIVVPSNAMDEDPDPWVYKNVLPLMYKVPPAVKIWHAQPAEFGGIIEEYLAGDPTPQIIADWPDDIRYFCERVITGPGTMIRLPQVDFAVRRVDAYPTTLPGAVQHNAWWDAMALRWMLEPTG